MRNLSTGIRGGYFNTGIPTFLEGTNAATIKSTVASLYSCDGLMYNKAITDNIAMTALALQADDTICLYGIFVNAAGTILMTKGVEVATANLTAGEAVLEIPNQPEGYAPLALMQITLDGGTFTCGTTDLSGAGVTDIFQDVSTLPGQPLTAALT